MRGTSHFLAAGLAALGFCSPRLSAQESCTTFALERSGTAIHLHAVGVESGHSEVFLPAGSSDGTIALVVASQPGMSGDLIQGAQALPLVARCEDGRLRVLAQLPGGAPREVMSRTMAELRRLRYSIGVTSWDGRGSRFGIDRWRQAVPESGPVLDLFAGKIPLGPGDYSITWEVTAVPESTAKPIRPTASIPVERIGGYLLIAGKLGGQSGSWLLDTAAGVSLIDPELVPREANIRPLALEETSAGGVRSLPFEAAGAGGAIEARFGTISLPVSLGPLDLGSQELIAGPRLPERLRQRTGRGLLGIVGLDILRGLDSIALSFVSNEATAGELSVAAVAISDPPELSLPLTETKAALVGRGRIGGIPLTLVLDTGSPRTFVSTRAAVAAALDTAKSELQMTGIDGRPLAVLEASASAFSWGEHAVGTLPVMVADLPVLAALDHGDQFAGLLGTDLLSRYRRWRIDFVAPRLDLWR